MWMRCLQRRWRVSRDGLEGTRRVLAVRLDNIGDVLMLSPALRALKRAVPGVETTLLCSKAGASVAPLIPSIDETIVFRALWQDVSGTMSADPAPERALASMLAAREFDAALIFTSFSQSPYPAARVCADASIPLRVGQSKEFGGGLLTTWVRPLGDEEHQVDRNLRLLEVLGVPSNGTHMDLVVPPSAREATARLLADAGIGPDTPFMALAPGASCDARSYGVEAFAEVAARLAERVGLPILLVGSPREVALCETLRSLARTPRVISIAEATDVPTLAAVVERASLLIGNDSAPMHFADALGTPVVVTFSGTDLVSQWGPRHAPSAIIRRDTPCTPCYGFICPYDKPCLAISPEEVARRAIDLLPESARLAAASA